MSDIRFGKCDVSVGMMPVRECDECGNEIKARGYEVMLDFRATGQTSSFGSAFCSRRCANVIAGLIRRTLPECEDEKQNAGKQEKNSAIPPVQTSDERPALVAALKSLSRVARQCSNVAFNLGQNREDWPSTIESVRAFDKADNEAWQLIRRLAPTADTPAPVEGRDAPEGCILTAHDTGDGWCLSVVDPSDNSTDHIAMLAWPESFGESQTPDELRAKGFVIV